MAEAKKRAKPAGRRAVILEVPDELLARVDAYTDAVAKADPYRPRSRNGALLVLIDAGLGAVSAPAAAPAEKKTASRR